MHRVLVIGGYGFYGTKVSMYFPWTALLGESAP
jgi:hypothetical protein